MQITIDERDPQPLYNQIAYSIKEIVRRGHLRPGDYLPSVRDLANKLQVNLHTVHRAYTLLSDESVIILRRGQRARIAPLRYLPASRAEIEQIFLPKLRGLVTEAYYLGLSGAEVKMLLEETLE